MIFLEKYGNYYTDKDKRTILDEDFAVLKNKYDIANKLPQIHFTQGNKVWMPIQYTKGNKDNPDFIQNLYHNVFKDIFYSFNKETHYEDLPIAIKETLEGLKTEKELEFASNIIQLFNFLSEDSKAIIVGEYFREEFRNSHDRFLALENIVSHFVFTRKDGTEVLYVLMDLKDTVGENTFENYLNEANDIAFNKGEIAFKNFEERQREVEKEIEKIISIEKYERKSLKGHELEIDFDEDNEAIPVMNVPENIRIVEILGYEDLDGNYYEVDIPLNGNEELEVNIALVDNESLSGTISEDGKRVHLKSTWDNLSLIVLGYVELENDEKEVTLSNEGLIRTHKDEIKEFLLDIYNKTLPIGIINTNLESDFIKVLREVAEELHEEVDDEALVFELGFIADLEDGKYLDIILLSSTYHRLLQIQGKSYSEKILYKLEEEKEPSYEILKGYLLQDENNDCNVFSSNEVTFNSLLPSGYIPIGIEGVFLNTGEYIDAKYQPTNIINLGKDEDQIMIDLRLTKEEANSLHLLGTFNLHKDEIGNNIVDIELKGDTEIAYVIVDHKEEDFVKEINAMDENLTEMEKELDDMGDKIVNLEKRINDIEEGMSDTIEEALENSNIAIEDDSIDPVEKLLNTPSESSDINDNIADLIKPKGEAIAINPKKVSIPDFIQGKLGGYDSNGIYKVYEVYANIIDGKLQVTSLEIKEEK